MIGTAEARVFRDLEIAGLPPRAIGIHGEGKTGVKKRSHRAKPATPTTLQK
jgi:hypothetical protein